MPAPRQSKWLSKSTSKNNSKSQPTNSIDVSSILANYSTNGFTYSAGGPAVEQEVVAGLSTSMKITQIFPPIDSGEEIIATLSHDNGYEDDNDDNNEDNNNIHATMTAITSNSATASFTLMKSGPYTVSLKIRKISDPSNSTSSSPTSITVSPSSPCPLHTLANGHGIVFAAPEESASFTVTTFDKFQNRCHNGGANFSVSITGNAVMDGSVIDEGDGTYIVNYTPTRGIQKKAVMTLPIRRHHEGAIECATNENGEWEERWFVLTDTTLSCFKDEKATMTSPETPPILTLDLTECAISEHVDFPNGPHGAAHHFQVVAPHLTLQMSCADFNHLSNWIALLKTSSVNGTLDKTLKQTTKEDEPNSESSAKLSRKERKEAKKIEKENKNKIIVNVTMNGSLLSCCPFAPEISAKKALEARMRRRSTVSELRDRNILRDDSGEFDEKRRKMQKMLGHPASEDTNPKRRASAANALKFSMQSSSDQSNIVIASIEVNKGFGWMNKKGHLRHNWKKRFFVLTTQLTEEEENYRLLYFSKAFQRPLEGRKWRSQEKFKKGLVELAGAKLLPCKGKQHHKNLDVMNEFQIVQRNGHVYEFYANSREEKEDWLEDLAFAIDEATARERHSSKFKQQNDSPEKISAEMFKLMDFNGDGQLDADEISAAKNVLIDVPAPWASQEEVRAIGTRQRQVLGEILKKLLATYEDEGNKVNSKIRSVWGLETSHKNLRIIMSTVALTKSPLRNPVCMCVQRVLEIERPIKDLYFNNEFLVQDLDSFGVDGSVLADGKSSNVDEMTNAAAELATKVAMGLASPPPPPTQLQQANQSSKRRVRPSQRLSEAAAMKEREQETQRLRRRSTLSPDGRSSRSNSESPRRRKSSVNNPKIGRPDWDSITSPDGKVVYSSPRRSSAGSVRDGGGRMQFGNVGGGSTSIGGGSKSIGGGSEDDRRRASIEAMLSGGGGENTGTHANKMTPKQSQRNMSVSSEKKKQKPRITTVKEEKAEWGMTDRQKKLSGNKPTTRAAVMSSKNLQDFGNIYSTLTSPSDKEKLNSSTEVTETEVTGGVQISAGHTKKLMIEQQKSRLQKTKGKTQQAIAVAESVLACKDLRIQLKLHRANNLISKDDNGFSDPYCKFFPVSKGVKLKQFGQKSRTKTKTLNPIWEEEFEWKVDSDVDYILGVVKDWDRHSSSEFLGEFKIGVGAMPSAMKKHVEIPLSGEGDRGNVTVSFCKLECGDVEGMAEGGESCKEDLEKSNVRFANDVGDNSGSPGVSALSPYSSPQEETISEAVKSKRMSALDNSEGTYQSGFRGKGGSIWMNDAPSAEELERVKARAAALSVSSNNGYSNDSNVNNISSSASSSINNNAIDRRDMRNRIVKSGSGGNSISPPKRRTVRNHAPDNPSPERRRSAYKSPTASSNVPRQSPVSPTYNIPESNKQRDMRARKAVSPMKWGAATVNATVTNAASTRVEKVIAVNQYGNRIKLSPEKSLQLREQQKMKKKLLARTSPARLQRGGVGLPTTTTSQNSASGVDIGVSPAGHTVNPPPRSPTNIESKWAHKFKMDGKSRSFFDLYPNMVRNTPSGADKGKSVRAGEGHERNLANNKNVAERAQWARVVDWLHGLKLEAYQGLFEEHGLVSLSAIELMEAKDLQEMNIRREHQPKLLKAIEAFSTKTRNEVARIEKVEQSVVKEAEAAVVKKEVEFAVENEVVVEEEVMMKEAVVEEAVVEEAVVEEAVVEEEEVKKVVETGRTKVSEITPEKKRKSSNWSSAFAFIRAGNAAKKAGAEITKEEAAEEVKKDDKEVVQEEGKIEGSVGDQGLRVERTPTMFKGLDYKPSQSNLMEAAQGGFDDDENDDDDDEDENESGETEDVKMEVKVKKVAKQEEQEVKEVEEDEEEEDKREDRIVEITRERNPSLHLAHVPDLNQKPRSDTGIHGKKQGKLTKSSIVIHEDIVTQEKEKKSKGLWKNLFSKQRKQSQNDKMLALARKMKANAESQHGIDEGAGSELAEKLQERRASMDAEE